MYITSTELRLQVANLSEKDIIEMIFFPVVNEACRVLAEGIAVKASDLDIAAVMGMGFPPYRYCYIYYRLRSLIMYSCFFESKVGIMIILNPTAGVGFCSGLICWEQNTFTQGWRNGQNNMEGSSNLVPTWLIRLPRVLFW